MIRCLAVDDEPLALEILEDYIQKVDELQLVATTTNALEALNLVQHGEVDLTFLDIQMPELTGIQFLKIINGKCDVILTTAYPQYALEGYELNVADYLLKPIAFDRFYRSIQKVIQQRLALIPRAELNVVENNKQLDYIFVKIEHKIQRIDLNCIYFIEGLKDYISIYTTSDRFVTLQNMKRMEETLPDDRFVRVHKSYIIALDKIESIERGKIFFEDKKVVPIGDTYKDAFFRRIGERNTH